MPIIKNTDRTLLVVDNNETIRKLIETTLKSQGYHKFFFAENGVEALSYCRDNPIDLILSNWDMPIMDGLELLKNIRAMDKTKLIPLLMISTETNEEKVLEVIEHGVNDFLVKPFTPQLLCKKVELVLDGKLPFIKLAPKKETNSSIIEKKIVKPRILVVDDLASNIDVIVGILKDNFKLRVATNGKKALELASEKSKPDLILLDIMMPGMDGLEVCRLLKSDPQTMDIPVIFLTAMDDTKTTIEGFSVGGSDYITKPVVPELLKLRINNYIKLKKSNDGLKNQVYNLMEKARLQDKLNNLES